MDGVVLYGVGSAVVVDVEESLSRSGLSVAAAVQNVAGEVRLLDLSKLVAPDGVTDDMKSLAFLVPLFTPAYRQQAAHEALAAGFARIYSLMDVSVARPRSLPETSGLYVNSGCILGAACHFDEFVFVNRGASVGHHARDRKSTRLNSSHS